MFLHYDKRKAFASPDLTESVIYAAGASAHGPSMLETRELLAKVEAKAASRAEIARVLGLAPPRITEMFKGERQLSYAEARKLCLHYKIEPAQQIRAAQLLPILTACFFAEPSAEWTESNLRRLAEEIEYGLELMNSGATSPPSQDAIRVAAQAAADRLRDRLESA